MTLAITGAAGWVGRHIVPLLRPRFQLRLIDIEDSDAQEGVETVRCDLRDPSAAVESLTGANSVLHLAAVAGDANFHEEIVPKNIVMMHNVLEACRKTGVDTFIFASSGQVVLGYDEGTQVHPEMPPRPIGPYAASIVFGEALGRHYHDAYGMRVFSLRLGWFGPTYTDEMREADTGWSWLSPRDLADLVTACIESKDSYGLYFAASLGAAAYWDLSSAERHLGWKPKDRPR